MNSLNQRLSILESTSPGGTEAGPKTLFKVSSNLNGNQTFTQGTVAKFDNLVFCYPSASAFNTSTYTYTVPQTGIYQFTYKLYPNYSGNNTNTNARIAININGSNVSISGSVLGNIETMTTLELCTAGDQVRVECSFANQGSLLLFMNPNHAWFTGILISAL
jgi:uncharacterized membrane protein